MLGWIAAVGTVVCLIYYIIIVVYSGFSTSFSWIWLLGAIFFGLLTWYRWYSKRYPRKLPLWMPVSAVTLVTAALVIFCVVEAHVFLGAARSDVANLDYVIVLGAKVKEEGISNSLKQRLDKAIEYSQDNPGTVLILSGGQGDDEPRSEAQVMYEYLLYNGVPEAQMILETASTSTVENIAYSKLLIQRAEEAKRLQASLEVRVAAPGPYMQVEEKPVQIGVLTSNFHVYRARKIAQKWGIPQIYGISAKSDWILFPHLCVRECAAILKDKLMGNM